MNRILFFILICLSSSAHFFAEETKKQEEQIILLPIRALISPMAPKYPVWIHGTVVSTEEEDAPILQDATGKIILFLSTDELSSLSIPVNTEIFAYGRVDPSPIQSTKNEFYAERILFPGKLQNK